MCLHVCVTLCSGYRIVSSAAGAAHSMALASDGSLFTWGDGSRGQLGHSQLQGLAAMIPNNTPVTMPTPQRISRLDPTLLSPENRCEEKKSLHTWFQDMHASSAAEPQPFCGALPYPTCLPVGQHVPRT